MESEAHNFLRPRYLFIRPPSVKTLEKRLLSRAQDSLEAITDRVRTASLELQVAQLLPFDGTIINDDLDKAYSRLKDFVHQDMENCRVCRSRKGKK